MKKSEIWNNVVDILSTHQISKDTDMFQELENLLKPKTKGQRQNRTIEFEGDIYYYCRYTGRYWQTIDMVYQNDEARKALKDKGYSKIGISIWNKGQKYLKDRKAELFDEIMSEKPDTEKMEKLKSEISSFDGNSSYGLARFITSEQEEEMIDSSRSA